MPFPVENPCTGITVLGSELGTASYLLGVGANGCLVYEAPSSLVCRVLAALPLGGAAVLGSTLLVGADCKMYTVALAETPLTANDSATVDFTASGTANHTLTASVKVSATAGNQLVANADGLFVPATDVCAAINALPVVSPWDITSLHVYKTAAGVCQVGTPPPINITFEGDIGAPQTLNLFPADPTRIVRVRGVAPLQTTISLGSANIDISLNRCLFGAYVPAGVIAAANYLGIDAAGCLVKAAVAAGGEATTVSDTSSVDMTLTGVDISATVKISATAGNILTLNADGLYVAAGAVNLCTLLTALDTATDLTVPVTAEVSYVRADGTCGRAPLPAGLAGTTCADLQALAGVALAPTDTMSFVGINGATGACQRATPETVLCNLFKKYFDANGIGLAPVATDAVLVVNNTNGLNCHLATLPAVSIPVQAPVGGTVINITAANPLIVRAFNNVGQLGTATTTAAGFLDIGFPDVCLQLDLLALSATSPAANDRMLVKRAGNLACEFVELQNFQLLWAVDPQTFSINTSGDGSVGSPWVPNVRISTFNNNAAVIRGNGDALDGLYVPNVCAQIAALPSAVFNANMEVLVRNAITGVCNRISYVPDFGHCAELTALALQAQPVGAEMLAYDPTTQLCVRIAVPSGGTGSESTTVADTTTVDLTLTGFQITAAVKVSTSANQALVVLADGLYVPTVCSVVAALAQVAVTATTLTVGYDTATGTCVLVPSGTALTVTDTETIDLTLAANNLQAAVIISPTLGNQLVANGSGLFVPALCTQIGALDTATDATVPAGAEVVYIRADGSCGRAAIPGAAGGGVVTATDTTSIDFTITGTDITGVVRVSATAGNAVVINGDGLYVPTLCTALNATALNLAPTTAATFLALEGGVCSRVSLCAVLNALDTVTDGTVPVGAEVVYVRADGSCGRAAIPGAAGGGVVTATDTTTIDFTITGTDITGVVRISATANNTVVANGDGLFVPSVCAQVAALAQGGGTATSFLFVEDGGVCARVSLCSILQTLDTVTDLVVPATADVLYITTTGACRRAPLPAAAGGGIVTATDTTTINFTITGTDITGVVNVSTDPDNAISIDATGLYAPTLCRSITDLTNAGTIPATATIPYRTAAGVCERGTLPVAILTATDTPAINFTILGTDITAVLTVSPNAGNAIVINANGVYAPDWCTAANNLGTIDANVPATAMVTYVRADGSCGRATIPAAAAGGITTATDTTTIDFTVAGTNITASVIVDPSILNTLVVNPTGLFVPNVCTQISALLASPTVASATDRLVIINGAGACRTVTPALVLCESLAQLTTVVPVIGSFIPFTDGGAPGGCGKATLCTILNQLDTATDATVPATADVTYIRADGSCGRAPLPAGGAVTCAAIQAVFVAGAGLIPATHGIMISDGANCLRVTMPAPCTLTNVGITGLVGNVAGDLLPGRFAIRQRTTAVAASATLSPATTDILLVNNSGGNVTITLGTPAACEPNVFHVKQTSASTNTITLTPAAGTIDGLATHVFGNIVGGSGESRMVVYDGANWHII